MTKYLGSCSSPVVDSVGQWAEERGQLLLSDNTVCTTCLSTGGLQARLPKFAGGTGLDRKYRLDRMYRTCQEVSD
jgi:hypothetical protein